MTDPTDRPPPDLDAIRARAARYEEDRNIAAVHGLAASLTSADVGALLAEVTALRAELNTARAELVSQDRAANPPIVLHISGPDPVEQARAAGYARGLADGRRGHR